MKIRHARELFEGLDIPVSQVAFNSGFLDPNYFLMGFKKKMDQTPGLCRKKVRDMDLWS